MVERVSKVCLTTEQGLKQAGSAVRRLSRAIAGLARSLCARSKYVGTHAGGPVTISRRDGTETFTRFAPASFS